jgi:hypothetical protein
MASLFLIARSGLAALVAMARRSETALTWTRTLLGLLTRLLTAGRIHLLVVFTRVLLIRLIRLIHCCSPTMSAGHIVRFRDADTWIGGLEAGERLPL